MGLAALLVHRDANGRRVARTVSGVTAVVSGEIVGPSRKDVAGPGCRAGGQSMALDGRITRVRPLCERHGASRHRARARLRGHRHGDGRRLAMRERRGSHAVQRRAGLRESDCAPLVDEVRGIDRTQSRS